MCLEVILIRRVVVFFKPLTVIRCAFVVYRKKHVKDNDAMFLEHRSIRHTRILYIMISIYIRAVCYGYTLSDINHLPAE